MKILITGSGGFIGYWLRKHLVTLGHELIDFQRSEHGDIASEEGRKSLDSMSFDHVFHLAASGTIVKSWEQIPQYIQNIDVGTSIVLERCRAINASYTYVSSYMYGMPKYSPIDENHPIASINPYALAKRLSEEICEFYSTQFSTKGTIIRPFGLYGPRQSRDFLVPTLLHQYLNEEVVFVNDLNQNKRDFLYIKDFVELLATTLNPKHDFEIFNAAQGESHTISEVGQIIAEVTGNQKELKSRNQVRTNEYTHLFGSRQKAKDLLGWEPKFTLRTAIADYIKEESL